MLLDVQIQKSHKLPISVVIIRAPGKSRSEYWAPFKDQDATAAYALNETEIIAYGQKGHIAVYNLGDGKTVRTCETQFLFGQTDISPDRTCIHILAQNRVSSWETSDLTRIVLFNGAEIEGDAPKVLSSEDDDFFPRLWRKEVDIFQSILKICALRDNRLCVVRGGSPGKLYLVDVRTLRVELPSISGPVHKALDSLDRPEDTFLQWATDPGVEAYARSLAADRLSITGFTEGAISTALNRTTAHFARGVAPYVTADILRLSYTYRDRVVEEEELFGLILEKRLRGVVPALRRLILAYLAASKANGPSQLWYDGDNGMAALCHPLRALILLDGEESYDVLRAYVSQRDLEHECFSIDVLFPELVRLKGWSSEADIAVGVFITLNAIHGGRGPVEVVWQQNDLIRAATSIVAGSRFAEIVLGEIEKSSTQSLWSNCDVESELYGLLRALPTASVFSEAVIKRLRTLAPAMMIQ